MNCKVLSVQQKPITLSCTYTVTRPVVQPAVCAASENQSSPQKTPTIDRRPRLLFRRVLSFGCSGKDVQLLHELLNKDPETHIDPQKLWSSGRMRDFFGNGTIKAVKRFQKKYDICSLSDPEFGIVGKKTIKKLRGLFGNGSFYLQGMRRLTAIPGYNEIESADLQNISLGMGEFIDRIARVFLAIFRFFFKVKPVFSSREYAFGNYFSISFLRAKKSPLLRLFQERHIAEFKTVEILIKNGSDQYINDTDIESIVTGVRKEENTLFILITRSHVLYGNIDRLFRSFEDHQVLILPLEDQDISRFEGWIAVNNINACLVSLIMIAERIMGVGEPMKERYTIIAKLRNEYIEAILDQMGGLAKSQLRTLIKKLGFLMSFMDMTGEVKKTCELVRIARKTFYNWRNQDPAFRNILRINYIPETKIDDIFPSLDISNLGNMDISFEDSSDLKIDEITHEST